MTTVQFDQRLLWVTGTREQHLTSWDTGEMSQGHRVETPMHVLGINQTSTWVRIPGGEMTLTEALRQRSWRTQDRYWALSLLGQGLETIC